MQTMNKVNFQVLFVLVWLYCTVSNIETIWVL